MQPLSGGREKRREGDEGGEGAEKLVASNAEDFEDEGEEKGSKKKENGKDNEEDKHVGDHQLNRSPGPFGTPPTPTPTTEQSRGLDRTPPRLLTISISPRDKGIGGGGPLPVSPRGLTERGSGGPPSSATSQVLGVSEARAVAKAVADAHLEKVAESPELEGELGLQKPTGFFFCFVFFPFFSFVSFLPFSYLSIRGKKSCGFSKRKRESCFKERLPD